MPQCDTTNSVFSDTLAKVYIIKSVFQCPKFFDQDDFWRNVKDSIDGRRISSDKLETSSFKHHQFRRYTSGLFI
jgi:hypothetical protein